MPQGTVIAVKPLGYSTEPKLMSYKSSQPADAGTRDAGVPNESGNLLYIEVYKDKIGSKGLRKVKSVVWHEDHSRQFDVGDLVEFNINASKTRPIKAAENLKKIRSGKLLIYGNLLSSVALIASAMLILAVALDKRK